MKKLLSLLLALALSLSLTAPALADMGFTPLETDPDWLARREAWIEAHPEERAAFDPDAWFQTHYTYYYTEEDYMAEVGLATREEFETAMEQDWLNNLFWHEDLAPEGEALAADFPEARASFDPEAWVERSWYADAQSYMDMWQVDEETFREHMWLEYASDPAVRFSLTYEAEHPEEKAAFDPDAWARDYFYCTGREEYVEYYGLEEGQTFEEAMWDSYLDTRYGASLTREWVDSWFQDHPEDKAAFHLEDWVEGQYGVADVEEYRTAYMSEWGLRTQEEFWYAMADIYISDREDVAETIARGKLYADAHPGAFAAFDPDQYFAGEYGSFYDKADFMTLYSILSEEEFRDYMAGDYAAELEEQARRAQEVALWFEVYPEKAAAFDPDGWFERRYAGWTSSAEDFMSAMGMTTREEFEAYMAESYMDHDVYMDGLQEDIDRALALDPAALDGFDPEAYLAESYPGYTFEEAISLFSMTTGEELETYLAWEYLIYAPYDLEETVAMGLQVMVNGTYLTFDGAQPYAEDGTTYAPAAALGEALGLELEGDYAPLRETGEAAGYEVYWDGDAYTAVLLDPAALKDAIDGQFTVLNGILAGQEQGWERWEREDAFRLTVSLPEEVWGEALELTLDQSVLTGPEGVQTDGSYDLSSLLPLIEQAAEEGELAREDRDLLAELLTGTYALRQDNETGETAVAFSGLSQLLEAAGLPAPRTLWITLEGEEAPAASVPTVGAAVWLACRPDAPGGAAPASCWSQAADTAYLLAALLGDQNFHAEGEDQVLSLDAAGLEGALGLWEGSLGDFSLEWTFSPGGESRGSLSFQDPGDEWSDPIRLTGSWETGPEGADLTLEYYIGDQLALSLEAESASRETSRAPETRPPEGSAQLSLDELTDEGGLSAA